MRKLMAVLCMLSLLCGCNASPAPQPVTPEQAVQYTQVDNLKGIWVSYLELDPALSGATKEAAAAYIDSVMDTCKKDGFNTVFFHVRAKGDAYYASDIFPAADSAKALLADGFDPLSYAIEAAHAREIALHAWINPYRIGTDRARAVCDDVYEWEGNWYYIPTSATAQRYILNGVREIVTDYAVDGVQYDDYFYPSGLPDTVQGFETPPATLSVGQWRAAAVSGLVAATKSAVHQRVGCLFGVSPAGNITRNTQVLYADVVRWLQYGYVDYLCPQLYSGFDNETLPFMTQADDWAALPRADGVQLYAGLALYKTGEADTFAGSGSNEWVEGGDILAHQVDYAQQKGYDGIALFRYAHWAETGSEVRETEKQTLKAILSK